MRSPWRLLAPLLIVVAGCVAYANSFSGVFLFDDRLHILGEWRLRTLWPLWEALAHRRPVVTYSLALNYALGGDNVWGYHAVNLAIHTLAALTLYGIVRRTLLSDHLRTRFGRASTWLALAAALIWIVHPLQTQAVTYIIQRAASLMGLFYLLTLYCLIRGADSRHRVWWYTVSVVSCVLGMGSKAVMVTAPVAAFLLDRVFIAKSSREAMRRRWGLYLGLAATWGVLWATGIARSVFNTSAEHASVGFGYKGVTPLDYALTQFGVLVTYLRLSLWPQSLCLDYYWPVARTAGQIIPPAIVILLLVSATVWALYKKPALGFVGAWFFIVLAPTSSFIPIKDPLFEHRMYLSLAAVVILVVIGVDYGLRYVATRLSLGESTRQGTAVAVLIVVVAVLTYGTVQRNAVYHNEVAMWRDTLAKRPGSPRALENLGTALVGAGEMEEAVTVLSEAATASPGRASIQNGLGFAFVAQGRLETAVDSFRKAVQLDPSFTQARLNLGNALNDLGRTDEAVEQFRAALAAQPDYLDAHLNLGNALLSQGRPEEAIEQYHEALRIAPEHSKVLCNLGTALLNAGRMDEAVAALREALRVDPEYYTAHNSLGIALAEQGKLDDAAAAFRKALMLKPESAQAHNNLADTLSLKGDTEGAIRHYRAALAIRPLDANTHFDLGSALAKQGSTAEAMEEYRETLRIQPDHTAARKALDEALAGQGRSGAGGG